MEDGLWLPIVDILGTPRPTFEPENKPYNTGTIRDIVRMAQIEQILLETDSPFLTPVPYRGKENAPFYLPFVAEKIAEVKELPLDEVIGKTYHKSLRTFFSSE